MQIPLTNDLKTDRFLIEQIVLIHILEVCLSNVGSDEKTTNKDDNWSVNHAWVELLDQECAMQITDLPLMRQRTLAKKIDMVTKEMLRSLSSCRTYREASLVVAILITNLTENMVIQNANNQGSLISALIIDENRETGDWGNYFMCSQLSWKWKKEFQRLGLFL